MTPALEAEIRGLAEIARPTERQLLDLLEGWERYFQYLKVRPSRQLEEFRGIMKARVLSGQISLVAPVSPPRVRRV